MEEIKVKFLSSLRLKITAAFLILSIALSVTLAFVSYRIDPRYQHHADRYHGFSQNEGGRRR